uniref:phosphopantetheine-binding protein n=1 Tax=uncultured Erythrobacter sp. TaxID=263913 RepID=UPI0026297900|nr:phosphopantetheine-binding protein [uncultured Erythrobacter sp.]
MSTKPVSETATQGPSEAAEATDAPSLAPSRAEIDKQLKGILVAVLGVDEELADGFDDDSGLFGHLPELDSMAVAGLLTEMEDQLDIVIEDDDVDGEMLETYGGLLAFAEAKIIAG